MKNTGLDPRAWKPAPIDPKNEPGGFCLLCGESFANGAEWDAHALACMDLASE